MKLVQQLVREVQRKPAKASLLALLVAVAVWFWGPLIGNWFGGGKASPANESSGEPQASQSEATTAAAALDASGQLAVAASSQTASWRDVARWIDNDPRMRPRRGTNAARNPFAPPFHEENENESMPAQVAATAEAAKAATGGSGLQLDGTLVGPRRRVAIINGKTYAVGDSVAAPSGTTWSVREVEALRVVLSHDGTTMDLNLVGATPDAAVSIQRNE